MGDGAILLPVFVDQNKMRIQPRALRRPGKTRTLWSEKSISKDRERRKKKKKRKEG